MIISVYVEEEVKTKVIEALKREYMYQGYHLGYMGELPIRENTTRVHLLCGMDCNGGGNGISMLTIEQFMSDIRELDENAFFMFR